MAIKKVLQDKRYKNRELQIMQLLNHPNVVHLKHHFFSTTDKDELYLNLVLEFVPETVYRVTKHYSRMNLHMPLIFVKLYAYQVSHSSLVRVPSRNDPYIISFILYLEAQSFLFVLNILICIIFRALSLYFVQKECAEMEKFFQLKELSSHL